MLDKLKIELEQCMQDYIDEAVFLKMVELYLKSYE